MSSRIALSSDCHRLPRVLPLPWPNSSQASGSSPPTRSGFARLGEAVALSADGNTAILGGGNDNSYAGAAWIFTRTNSVLEFPATVKLVGSGAPGMAEQGYVRRHLRRRQYRHRGRPFRQHRYRAAWVFTRTNGVWTQQGSKLVGSGATGIGAQGSAVAIVRRRQHRRGRRALGQRQHRSRLDLHRARAALWTQQGAKLTGAGAVGPSMLGSALSISADGNTVVAGGHRRQQQCRRAFGSSAEPGVPGASKAANWSARAPRSRLSRAPLSPYPPTETPSSPAARTTPPEPSGPSPEPAESGASRAIN